MIGEGAGLLRALPREPAVKHVHRELRRAILQGKLPPGSRLVETTLAQSLSVSRTPVREAIQRLETEGLVSRRPHGGVIVEDIRSSTFETVLIRQALEGSGVRMACARGSNEELASLAQQAARDAGNVIHLDFEERGRLDRAFHIKLAQLTHSVRLYRLIEEFYENTWNEFLLELPKLPSEASIRLHGQHVGIAEAIAKRDADTAEDLMRQHIDAVHRVMTEHLASMAQKSEPEPEREHG